MNLYGSVRAAETAGSGLATVMLTLNNWAEGQVLPTTHSIEILPAKSTFKVEPVSPALVATLPHPEKSGTNFTVQYSDDGKRLFTAGYPSGVIQFWDLDSRKEIYRIEAPKDPSGSDYALLTKDWKTLYVTTEDRKVIPVEKDGKTDRRITYTGKIRCWDLTAQKELEPLSPPSGFGNQTTAELSPDSQYIVAVERRDTLASKQQQDSAITVVWDLAAKTRTVLGEGYQVPQFAPDGTKLVTHLLDYTAKITTVKVFAFPECQLLKEWRNEGKDGRVLSVSAVSPDGKVVACALGGVKGAEPTTLFLDADTLKEQARWTGQADKDQFGWDSGLFTPDGKHYLIIDGQGKLTMWDVTAKKAIRTVELGNPAWQKTVSLDGRWLASSWMPQWDTELTGNSEPDPQDLPQPRVTLIDLSNPNSKPITLIAPHGYVGAVAFSPDAKQLAFGSSGGIHLFNLTNIE